LRDHRDDDLRFRDREAAADADAHAPAHHWETGAGEASFRREPAGRFAGD
jgi:hypothetical protein